MRAARRHPSDIGIQQFSMTWTAWGNRSMIFMALYLRAIIPDFRRFNLEIFAPQRGG
jgi:hypothetical protein